MNVRLNNTAEDKVSGWVGNARCEVRIMMVKGMGKELLALDRQAQVAALAKTKRLAVSFSSSPPEHPAVAIMNWTGGSLQRTKKANTGVVQQQRAYFAKARTHFQMATNSPAAPGFPNYLRKSEDAGFLGIPLFGSGSVRHTGHSATLRGGRRVPELPPNDACPTTRYHREPPHGLPHGGSIDGPAWSHDPRGTKAGSWNELLHSRNGHVKKTNDQTDFGGRKRKATNNNTELEVLEAKKKRLLAQQDWVGIDASKPVSLRFPSSKEKDKFGKRRTRPGSHHATLGRKLDDDFGGCQPHAAGEAFTGAFKGGATRSNVEDIKIRIGADVLTNAYSTQAEEHAQSYASSDSMLFDQESPPSRQHPGKLDPAPPANPQLHATLDASEQISDASLALLAGETCPYCHGNWYRGRPSGRDASGQGMLACSSLLELHVQHAAVEPKATDEYTGTPDYRPMPCSHGDARSPRLVFGGSPDIAPGSHEIGETKDFDESKLAAVSQTEYVRRANIAMEQSYAEEASAAPAIVDEGDWKRYLAIFDTAAQPENSTLQHVSAVRHDSEAAANWSQYATASQGHGASTSSISAFLPCVKRGIGKHISAHSLAIDAGYQGIRDETTLERLDNDERNWRAFVLGSDDQSSVQSADDVGGESISNYSEDASPMYLRLSGDVSTVRTRPVSREARFASCMRHNAQKLAPPAPPRSCNARSPAFYGRIESSDGERKAAELEGKVLERRTAATHATLADHASCDLVSSKVVDATNTTATTTSRSTLELLTRARAPCYPPGTTSLDGCNVIRDSRGSCSFYDTPASDDEALDIVDPNKR